LAPLTKAAGKANGEENHAITRNPALGKLLYEPGWRCRGVLRDSHGHGAVIAASDIMPPECERTSHLLSHPAHC
jgi:hypothetical protein